MFALSGFSSINFLILTTNFLYNAHHSLLQQQSLCALCRKYYSCFKRDDLEAFLLLDHVDINQLVKLATMKPSNTIVQYLIDHYEVDLNKIYYELVRQSVFHAYKILKFMSITINIANNLLLNTRQWFKDIEQYNPGKTQVVIDMLNILPKFPTLQFNYNMLNLLSCTTSPIMGLQLILFHLYHLFCKYS